MGGTVLIIEITWVFGDIYTQFQLNLTTMQLYDINSFSLRFLVYEENSTVDSYHLQIPHLQI